MSDKVDPITNEHVLEIRYRPNPRVLDRRGTWAESISAFMSLEFWSIGENRIDLFSGDKKRQAFVGFRNTGLVIADTKGENEFPEEAIKLMQFVFGLEEFEDPLPVERLGVRSRFCTPYGGSFEELRSLYCRRFIHLTPEAQKAIGEDCSLDDICGNLNFVKGQYRFNTVSGPMPQMQFPQFFRKKEGFPKVGLFFDIDYWWPAQKEVDSKEIIRLIGSFAEKAWERHGRVSDQILKGGQ